MTYCKVSRESRPEEPAVVTNVSRSIRGLRKGWAIGSSTSMAANYLVVYDFLGALKADD